MKEIEKIIIDPRYAKVRKITPMHAVTRVEEDKSKRIPRKAKYKQINIPEEE